MNDDIDAIVAEALAEPEDAPQELFYPVSEHTDDEIVEKVFHLYTISEGMAPYPMMRASFLEMNRTMGVFIEEGEKRGLRERMLARVGRTRW